MTDAPDTAAERLQRLADGHAAEIDFTRGYLELDDGEVADLRAVLAEHQQMREQLDGMTTSYGLEWTNRNTREHGTTAMTSETKAQELAAACHDHECTVVRRLVGPWQPTDTADASDQQHQDGT